MTKFGNFSADSLKQLVARIERLETEKLNILDDIKDVYLEAKGQGYDVKILRQIIRIRKLDRAKLEEQEHLIEVYKQALDMVPETISHS